MFKKIQHQFIFSFLLFSLAILSVSGWLHYWQARESLELELGRKLISVGQAISSQLDIQKLLILEKGDEKTRTYRNQKRKLLEVKRKTDLKKIYLFSPEFKSLIDTDDHISIGDYYPSLQFDQVELASVLNGNSESSRKRIVIPHWIPASAGKTALEHAPILIEILK